eukprot:1542820-Rhodomonas_salina.1
MDEKVKEAQEEAQNALDDRDRLMQEAEEKIKAKEKEMEKRRELAGQVMQEQQDKSMQLMRDIMDGFAAKVALHLSVVKAEGDADAKPGGMSEEDLAALQVPFPPIVASERVLKREECFRWNARRSASHGERIRSNASDAVRLRWNAHAMECADGGARRVGCDDDAEC